MAYKKENIRSIGELSNMDGSRTLTPVFQGEIFPVFVRITKKEFEKVRGNEDAMKDLSIKKLNEEL